MHSPNSDAAEPGYGWVMVFVAFTLVGLSFGGFGAVGVFLKPLAAEFHWSRGSVSLGYTASAFAAALCGILWGYLADAYPTRRFSVIGALAIGVAMLLLSRTSALWQLYFFYFLYGALGHAALNTPLYANVGFWFTRNKGLAIGVMAAGGAIGQAVVPLTARLLISAYGWRTAYLVLGLVYLAVGVGVALLTRDPPARRAHFAGANRSAGSRSLGAARTSVAWLSIAVVFCCVCMAVPIVHVVALVSDRGIEAEMAAGVLTTMMLFGAFGRVGAGKLADHVGPMRTYIAMSLLQTVLVIWFPHVPSLIGTYVLAALFGFAFSGVMSCILVCVRAMVPVPVGARSLAIVLFFGWFGMGLGGYLGGAVFDLTGNYVWSYLLGGIAGAINLAILIAFSVDSRRRRAAAAA